MCNEACFQIQNISQNCPRALLVGVQSPRPGPRWRPTLSCTIFRPQPEAKSLITNCLTMEHRKDVEMWASAVSSRRASGNWVACWTTLLTALVWTQQEDAGMMTRSMEATAPYLTEKMRNVPTGLSASLSKLDLIVVAPLRVNHDASDAQSLSDWGEITMQYRRSTKL